MRRAVIATLCFLLPALLTTFYMRQRLVRRPQAAAGPRLFTVHRADIAVKVAETGTVEPLTQVEVKSKVGGKVLRLLAAEGDRVHTGQVLAVLDPIEQQSQVGQIRAQVAAARARLAQAVSEAGAERRTVQLGIAEAQEQLRVAESRLGQAIRQEQVQPLLTRMAVAQSEANDRAARQTLERINRSGGPQELADAQSNRDQARADCDLTQKDLARQQILLARGFVPQSTVDEAVRQAATARARLRAAEAHFDTMKDKTDADRREAEARVAQSSAARDAARANGVQDELRREDVTAARASRDTARVALERAQALRSEIDVRDAEVVAARASVTQLESSLAEVETQLRDTVLRAPMAGVVTRRYVEVGELVTSGIQTFSSGTPLMQIADLSRMQVRVQVNEVDVSRLRAGERARIELDASRGASLEGRVTAVAPASAAPAGSPGQPAGGSGGGGGIVRFEVKIDILHADPRLRPGMSANVDIITAERQRVLTLPLEAVDLAGSRVKRRVAGRAVDTPVKLGLRSDTEVEIVSGLREGDAVFPARYTGPPRRRLQFGPDGVTDG
jgi:HlyD family secretion protein